MMIDQKIAFIKQKLNSPITFVGLMGAGKTSVGKALAQRLALDFVDSDHVVEVQEGCTIPELFKIKGEAYFRECERETILSLAREGDIKVIGTGGGAFMNDQTRDVMLEKTTPIFLTADFDVLRTRLGDCEGRPLLKGDNPENVLKRLIVERYPIYEKSEMIVETKDEPLQETLNRVIETLYTHLSDR